MAEILKDKFFNYDTLLVFGERIHDVYPEFPVADFITDIIDETWADLELKARMRQVTLGLGKYLPADYRHAQEVLDNVVDTSLQGVTGMILMCFPDFVEVYGQDVKDLELSIDALERYTQLASSEFAIRPFIINHEQRMLQQLILWAEHKNEHVRRLASEGCRPQLPWAPVLHSFKQDPTPILPILEQLKADPSLYVRKSVANNLNDISKTHPDVIIKLAQDWYGDNEHTNWIVKHACRTLLKKGNRAVLEIFGFGNTKGLEIAGFTADTTTIELGTAINFSFEISAQDTTKVRLEYAIDYMKANGKRNRKIFQIAELSLNKNEKKAYTKKHAFAELSTRKHYPGLHSVTLIANGVEQGTLDFELVE